MARTPFFLLLFAAPATAADVSGNLTLTTDYVFRGISQTRNGPAPQAGMRVDADSGLYASLWASRIDYDTDASAEVDYVAGGRKSFGDWSLDLNATRFTYPRTQATLDYLEWIATATWRDRAWAMVGVSNDVFGTRERGVYAQLGTAFPLRERLRLELVAGRYALDVADYMHAQAALAWSVRDDTQLRLTGHITDDDARALFGDVAGGRLEASITTTF